MQPNNVLTDPERMQCAFAGVDASVVLIEAALTPQELSHLRAELEGRGFRATGGRYPAGYRDNDRLVFDDPLLAARLFDQLAPHLPAEVRTADGARAVLVGLNPRFRACRYRDGQSFRRHRDGAYAPEPGVRSERTLMLYLTDGSAHEGGRTRFYPSADPAEPASLCITPRAGLATVFPHDAWHDGEPVTGGTKVVLRSDLLYRRCDEPDRSPVGDDIRHRGYVWDLAECGPQRLLSVARDGCVRRMLRVGGQLRSDGCWPLRLASPTSVACQEGGVVLVGSRHGQVASLRLHADGTASESPPRRVGRGAILNLAACAQGFVASGADGAVHLLSDDGAPLARHALHQGGFLWGLAPLSGDRLVPGSLRTLPLPAAHEWLVGGERGRVHRLRFDGERFHELARTPLRAPLRSLAVHAQHGTWVGLEDGHVAELGGTGSTRAHAGPVTALALLADGRLASGGEDGRVCLWSVAALRAGAHSRPAKLLTTRRDFVTRLLPSADALFCAGYDGCVTSLDTIGLGERRNCGACSGDTVG
ncbi:MAG: 2OG-Fe(II) oxygenase [Myxococcales bacterium]|nr:2OG-Fe(II) oxygenase [Myxococcales bacterium]MCB9628987.1 2OG-Fe(II) oxygenase [Sandaracinaceae bacterium]